MNENSVIRFKPMNTSNVVEVSTTREPKFRDLELWARHLARAWSVLGEASDVSCELMSEALAVLDGERPKMSLEVMRELHLRAYTLADHNRALEYEAMYNEDVLSAELMRWIEGLAGAVWDDTLLSIRHDGMEDFLLFTYNSLSQHVHCSRAG